MLNQGRKHRQLMLVLVVVFGPVSLNLDPHSARQGLCHWAEAPGLAPFVLNFGTESHHVTQTALELQCLALGATSSASCCTKPNSHRALLEAVFVTLTSVGGARAHVYACAWVYRCVHMHMCVYIYSGTNVVDRGQFTWAELVLSFYHVSPSMICTHTHIHTH